MADPGETFKKTTLQFQDHQIASDIGLQCVANDP